MQHPILSLLILTPLVGAAPQEAGPGAEASETPWGHSLHGAAYDEGPRQKPWIMEGVGEVSFPITTADPEVQTWFNQAVALMHGFWWYEAERSLRWCLKLDPECAMAYWALALTTRSDEKRRDEFLAEAVARKGEVSDRERRFIECSEAFAKLDGTEGEEGEDRARRTAMRTLDQLLMEYPEDLEARAFYWLFAGDGLGREDFELSRYAMESVLEEVLEQDPDHVGALHYRVHNWDGKEGQYAADSCLKLSEVAPRSGHLQHMPGHVLSSIGMWHEAAIAMDRATRVEKDYMNRRMILPEDNWDYVHNLDYLGYLQEQLGMFEQALLGAEQLRKSPGFSRQPMASAMLAGPRLRALVKFERWEELLAPDPLSPPGKGGPNPFAAIQQGTLRTRALLGLGRIDEAAEALAELEEKIADMPEGPPGAPAPPKAIARRRRLGRESAIKALEGRLKLARGEHLRGLNLLTEAAEAQEEVWSNDPPRDGEYLFNSLGDVYLDLGAPRLAAECFERTLETVIHDGFALAGLVVAQHRSGNEAAAVEAMAKLKVVWSNADRPNRWLEAAEATGVQAQPHLDTPFEQRNYREEVLDPLGPSLWTPSDVPHLSALDAEGSAVTLADHRGSNVLLIFYLGESCVHCIEQIQLAEEKHEELGDRDTVVLAVSRDTVERIAGQQETLGVTLLSDLDFENARRFQSHDDFEDLELHSTFLIDREGRLHWSRIGGEPFTDFDFLLGELDRLNHFAKASGTVLGAAEAPGE